TLLRRLREPRLLGFPSLVGTYNKSVIGNALNLPQNEREEGTAATIAAASGYGADGVRVPDARVMRRGSETTERNVQRGSGGGYGLSEHGEQFGRSPGVFEKRRQGSGGGSRRQSGQAFEHLRDDAGGGDRPAGLPQPGGGD